MARKSVKKPATARRSADGGTLSDLALEVLGGTMAKRKSAKKSTRKTAKKSTRKTAKKSARKTARKSTRKTARKSTRKTAAPARKTTKRKAAKRKLPFTKVKKGGKGAVVVAKGGLVKVGKNVYRANPWGGMLSPNANIVEKTLGMSMVDIGALLAAGGSYSAINGVLSRLPILNKVKATLDNTPGVKIISSSILPMLAGILLKKYLGNKNRMADAFGSALIITSISGVGVSALSPLINKTAGGLSGVDYTPYGALPEGLEGVDYTPYGGVPEGLEGADFGAADFGSDYELGEGEEEMGDGEYEFGGVDFTPYGGVPEGLEGVPEGLEGYSQAQMG
jgi:hypothetical protein